MLVIQPQIFSARKWPILLIFLFIGGPFLYIKFSGDPKQVADIFITGAVMLCLILYFVVSRIKIEIDNNSITHKTLIRTSSIEWKQIANSSLSFEFHGHSGDVKWLIVDRNGEGLGISLSYFSRQDNCAIAEVLVSKCPSANISDKVRNMANGKFPWYIF